MNRKSLILLLLAILLAMSSVVYTQQFDNRRYKAVSLINDTTYLDTLSILPGTVIITNNAGMALSDSLYKLDYVKALLITDAAFRMQYPQVNVQYRVLSVYLSKQISKKSDALKTERVFDRPSSFYTPSPRKADIYGLGGLTSSGSISRGISVGNNQDVVVNSTLNLQLSGKISDDLYIAAAITDNNIPIQPDGTTQQLQEFDKVFIQLYNKTFKLTAGDYDIGKKDGHFMRFFKKAQGGLFDLNYTHENEKGRAYTYNTKTAAAIAKGKYARNIIEPIEGNQGPYKLRGANNELYIIVIAGSERVFLDGRLLQRGQDFDYIIDYNTAELTFMPKQLITKDKRIIVEFEYSDKNYARSMFYSDNTIENDKFSVNFSFISEQDMKNQTLFQELTPENKMLLSQIGDSLHMALLPNIDSLGFDNNYVMYEMRDTLVNGILYDSVFVYSINPDSAHYRLGFSMVGQGKGNYRQIQSAANGRVFEWVAPLNGVRQGAYEPVILLVTPQKQQMFTLSGAYKFSTHTQAMLEIAVSNNDLNTFSDIDNSNNTGMAVKFGMDDKRKIKADSLEQVYFQTTLSHEWTQQTFKPIERYRDAEFNRNWNLTSDQAADEHLSSLRLSVFDAKNRFINYSFNSFLRDTLFQGFQNSGNISWHKKGFFVNQNTSLTQTDARVHNSRFLRSGTTLGKHFRYFTFGVKNELEDNRFTDNFSDSLMLQSQKFEQFEVFIQNPDTTKNKFSAFYKLRNDFFVKDNSFNLASKADEVGFLMGLNKNPTSRLQIYTAYRHLYSVNSFLTEQGINPDKTVIGRLEYFGSFFKGLLTLNTFYETGTGLEVKKEFSYVEVQPGQGVYTWTDYNNNGVKELDEFEIAAFQDQANYIRVFTPTNEYVKAYTNQYNQIINILPNNLWRNEDGLKKFLARFANRTFYQLNKKILGEVNKALNPFEVNVNDSVLLSVNASFRNNFSFNNASPVWGLDYTFSDNRSKMLLINGFDSRTYRLNTLKLRWNLSRVIFFNTSVNMGQKTSASEYFSNRDYSLSLFDVEPIISYQKGSTFRNSIIFKYDIKENIIGADNEKAVAQTLSNEIRYSRIEKGSLTFRISYIQIKYNAPQNTPIAYEMLNGLNSGHNITWSLLFQRTLKNNMQLSLIYDGRKPYEMKTIHYGSVQLRAFF